MTAVNTHAWSTALEPDKYANVDTFELAQEYLEPGDLGDTGEQTLVLKSLERTGKNGGTVNVPPIGLHLSTCARTGWTWTAMT
ncbi:hypothetical protein ACODT4_00295 [Streptomyces sp. 2.9]|uniref:hypothetical protein n=1 Tax=Streptomyces tritrimontium TaxID=3406573 RepID=UPI003BB81273